MSRVKNKSKKLLRNKMDKMLAITTQNMIAALGPIPPGIAEDFVTIMKCDIIPARIALGCSMDGAIDVMDYKELANGIRSIMKGIKKDAESKSTSKTGEVSGKSK